MPYTDEATFEFHFKHRDVSGWPGTSEFTMMIEEYSAEINRFHDISANTCDVSDNTMESELHIKYINDLLEEKLVYIEQAENIAVQNRVATKSPSLFDDNHIHIRKALIKEKREERPVAYNYNLRTGRVRRWS